VLHFLLLLFFLVENFRLGVAPVHSGLDQRFLGPAKQMSRASPAQQENSLQQFVFGNKSHTLTVSGLGIQRKLEQEARRCRAS